MRHKNDESQLMLAVQAMQSDPKLRLRVAARIYSVDHRKLRHRLQGVPSRRDIQANSRKLSNLEESVLVQYILDLAAEGFPPQLSIVEDMANRLLATRDAPRVGSRWASNFPWISQDISLQHCDGRKKTSNMYLRLANSRSTCTTPGQRDLLITS
jgi:hypothetical protein